MHKTDKSPEVNKIWSKHRNPVPQRNVIVGVARAVLQSCISFKSQS